MSESRELAFWDLVRADWKANEQNPKGRLLLPAFRVTHLFATSKNKLFWILGLPLQLLYRVCFEWVLCIELPAKTSVGPGLRVMHGQALVINPLTRIGANCILRQSTTLGAKILQDGSWGKAPILGDRVDVGSNAVIIGEITIGNDVKIGAGTVVVRDVPHNCVVVGNPGRILDPRRTEKSS